MSLMIQKKQYLKKKQRAMLSELGIACSDYVQNELVATLRVAISEKLETLEGWSLEVDAEDPDGQTLQFEYPSTAKKDAYIRPSVKIELGARAEHWPVSKHKIQSYVKSILKEKVEEPEVWVKALEAKRTFWEKATILHQYAHLPHDKKLPPRISRHYYDFFCLLNSTIKVHALEDGSLLDRVAIHKSIYFASAWANYSAAQKGSLKLVPPPYIFESLERDYSLMKDMFFGSIPDWPTILNVINHFEIEFNQKN